MDFLSLPTNKQNPFSRFIIICDYKWMLSIFVLFLNIGSRIIQKIMIYNGLINFNKIEKHLARKIFVNLRQ